MKVRRFTAGIALALASLLPALPLGATAAGPPVQGLPAHTDGDYQLGGPAARPSSVGILVRDRTAKPAPGRYNICYVNGFQTQPDAKRFWLKRQHLLVKKDGKLVSDSAWGEWIFDVRSPEKRKRLMRIIGPWIDGCGRAGFAAVEFDNLDSFTRSKRVLARKHNLAFAKLLIARAHANGLAAGQKNLAGYDGTAIGFDFAVAEECGRYRECSAYVEDFGSQVFMVEYGDAAFARACGEFGPIHPIVRRDLMLKPSYQPRYC